MAQGVMYLTMKIIAVFAITFMRLQADAEKGMVLISALAFSCYFLFQFLMAREHRKRNIIFAGFAAAGCFFGLVEQQLPLLLVIVVELIDYLSDGQMLYQLSIIAGLILLFVFSAQDGGLLVSILVFGFTLFMRNMVKHIQILKEQNLKQKGQIQELRKKVMDLNTYTKTLCQTTAMEERKRFAARIHDQLGHGISGSILLLEGAKLQMDDNPALAKETISKATDN